MQLLSTAGSPATVYITKATSEMVANLHEKLTKKTVHSQPSSGSRCIVPTLTGRAACVLQLL